MEKLAYLVTKDLQELMVLRDLRVTLDHEALLELKASLENLESLLVVIVTVKLHSKSRVTIGTSRSTWSTGIRMESQEQRLLDHVISLSYDHCMFDRVNVALMDLQE